MVKLFVFFLLLLLLLCSVLPNLRNHMGNSIRNSWPTEREAKNYFFILLNFQKKNPRELLLDRIEFVLSASFIYFRFYFQIYQYPINQDF